MLNKEASYITGFIFSSKTPFVAEIVGLRFLAPSYIANISAFKIVACTYSRFWTLLSALDKCAICSPNRAAPFIQKALT
jgi:hypothetical protein